MPEPGPSETCQTISRAADGDPRAVKDLMLVVYERLRELAARYLRRERPDHTLQPTALVHEAYLHLVDRTGIDARGKTCFLAIAAKEMRRVLIHHARARKAQKRGRGWVRVDLDRAVLGSGERDLDLLDLVEALEKLARVYPRQAEAIQLRIYGGLSVEETAQVLGVAAKTIEKDWRMARAWLHRHLKGGYHQDGTS